MSAPNSRPGSVLGLQSQSQYNTFDEKAFLADAARFRDARFLECGRQLRLAVHADGQPPWMTVADETMTVRELIAKLEGEFEEIGEGVEVGVGERVGDGWVGGVGAERDGLP